VGVFALLVTFASSWAQNTRGSGVQTARGVVYHDANNNQQRDAGEAGLPGIRVSNGRDIVATDVGGKYELPVDDDTILFVVKPRGWRTPLSKDMLPRFYYIHKPSGSPALKFGGVEPTGPLPASVDFALYPQDEPETFEAILFGDTQPRNLKEVEWIAHDVLEDLVGTDASFGVTLGDIVFDDLSVMPHLTRAVALLGIPWYNVIGNHDINYDAKTRRLANETYERVFGPSYYSFDYGPTHFIVLDDIEWVVNPENGKGTYRGGFGPDQLAFVKNDLEQIPADQMVVLMMHIPLNDVDDRHGLYRLIEQRPFCISISGHTHTHEHVWITKEDGWEGPQPHHHIINVTVCGSWWSGAPDERGIPHTTMSDGGPNGYSILSFDGTDYRLDYYAASRPASYQMEIDAPEVLPPVSSGEKWVHVNVFNGSERTVVEMRVAGGEWRAMEHAREIDPKLQKAFEREAAILEANKKAWRPLSEPSPSTHLWKALLPVELPEGTHSIEVRATDHWGRVYEDRRLIRIEP
jgi:hypothetical protein